MPRHGHKSGRPIDDSDNDSSLRIGSRERFRNPPGRDELEYLREGGNIRETRKDMESLGRGSYRTYSHNDEQDGDNDFDSSYADGDNEEEFYGDTEAQNRFLRGENENNDYGSSSGYGNFGKNTDRNEQQKYGASTGYGGSRRDYAPPPDHIQKAGYRGGGR